MVTSTGRQQSVEYKRPWVYPKQEDALFHNERYGMVEATTKSGKTVGCIIWIVEQALQGKPGYNYWWVAPINAQAKIAFRRLKRALPADLYHANETEQRLDLANQTTIWFKSAEDADSLYGEDVYAAVIDEASRVREESWHAVRTTLTATRGPIRCIGNVKGKKNWFFRLCRRAQSGSKGMHYAKLTAYDAIEAGILAGEEVEDAQDKLPENVFRELYLAEAGDDGTNPFGDEHIKACERPALAAGPPVAFGIDLAKKRDWVVVIGLNQYGEVCEFERWQGPWETTQSRIRAIVGGVPGFVDSTGSGDPVTERLVVGTNLEGFLFTPHTKQQLMEALAVSIQHHEITIPTGVIIDELEVFEYRYTRTGVRYSAPDGMFDDCVCALAMAVLYWRRLPASFSVMVGGDRDTSPISPRVAGMPAVMAGGSYGLPSRPGLGTSGGYGGGPYGAPTHGVFATGVYRNGGATGLQGGTQFGFPGANQAFLTGNPHDPTTWRNPADDAPTNPTNPVDWAYRRGGGKGW